MVGVMQVGDGDKHKATEAMMSHDAMLYWLIIICPVLPCGSFPTDENHKQILLVMIICFLCLASVHS